MKKVLFFIVAVFIIGSGCSSEEDKQRAHELRMMKIQAGQYTNEGYSEPRYSARPVGPGSYTNYMGDPQHGRWNQSGNWQWHNPYGPQASQTSNYLIAAGLGATAAHLFTKSRYESELKSKPRTQSVTGYMDRSGKKISKTQFETKKAIFTAEKNKQQRSYSDKKKTIQKKKMIAKTNPSSKSVESTKTNNSTFKKKVLYKPKPVKKLAVVKKKSFSSKKKR